MVFTNNKCEAVRHRYVYNGCSNKRKGPAPRCLRLCVPVSPALSVLRSVVWFALGGHRVVFTCVARCVRVVFVVVVARVDRGVWPVRVVVVALASLTVCRPL